MLESKPEEHAIDEKKADASRSSVVATTLSSKNGPIMDPLVFGVLLVIAGLAVYSAYDLPDSILRGKEFLRELSREITVPDRSQDSSGFGNAVVSKDGVGVKEGRVDASHPLPLPAYMYPYPLPDAVSPPPSDVLLNPQNIERSLHVARVGDAIQITWPKEVTLRAAYLTSPTTFPEKLHHLFGYNGDGGYTGGYFEAELPPFLPPGTYSVIAFTDDPSSVYVQSEMSQPILIKYGENGFLVFRPTDSYRVVHAGDQGAAIKVFINDPALTPYPVRALSVELIPRRGVSDGLLRTARIYDSGYFRPYGSEFTQAVFPLNIPEDMPPGEYDLAATLRFRTENSEQELSHTLLHSITVEQ